MEFGRIFSKSIDDYKKNWEIILGITAYIIIYGIINLFISELSDVLGFIINIFTIVFMIGAHYLCLRAGRGEKLDFKDLFIGFRERTGRLVLLNILIGLFCFLWGLLLVIPGIIKGLAYSQAFYIYLDKPELTANECIDESKKIMDGYKLDFFTLDFLLGLVLLLFTAPVFILVLVIVFFDLMETTWIKIIFTIYNYGLFPFLILFNVNFYLTLTGWGPSVKTRK